MSTHRIHPEAGWVDPTCLPRGPEGRGLCRHCGREVPKRRRTFCGDLCVERWKMKTDPSFLRNLVWKRDRGRCARCGLKCRDLEKSLSLLRQLLVRLGHSKAVGNLRSLLKIQSRHTFWDADHIRPVAEGGGECGLENMQTLCLWCHRDKTAAMLRGVERWEKKVLAPGS